MQKFKSFNILILIFCLSANFIYAQFSSYKIVEKENGLDINLSFTKQPFSIEGEKGGVINYFNSTETKSLTEKFLSTVPTPCPPQNHVSFCIHSGFCHSTKFLVK